MALSTKVVAAGVLAVEFDGTSVAAGLEEVAGWATTTGGSTFVDLTSGITTGVEVVDAGAGLLFTGVDAGAGDAVVVGAAVGAELLDGPKGTRRVCPSFIPCFKASLAS